jgi:glycosyltransferase involved in cell wall biosynthesis
VHGHSVGGTNPALLEALGAGAPVLAFDTVFNREVLGELDAYYDSAPSLSRALGRMLGSPGLRRELSRAGQHQVRERYSWPDVCDHYLALLQELADGGAPRRAATGGE